MCGTRRNLQARNHPAGSGLPALPMQLSQRAGVHACKNTLRSTLPSPSFHSTGTVAPQKRPQTSSAYQQALRPRWPRAGLARRATVPVAEEPQLGWPRARPQKAWRNDGHDPAPFLTKRRKCETVESLLADSSPRRRGDAGQGRARPACAGRAAICRPETIRRAEDCPPYLR